MSTLNRELHFFLTFADLLCFLYTSVIKQILRYNSTTGPQSTASIKDVFEVQERVKFEKKTKEAV